MESPYTGKPMRLHSREKTLQFRGELFKINYTCYICEDTGDEFVTAEMGDANLNQVYEQYKAKHPEWERANLDT